MSNLYVALKNLFPEQPLEIATIVAISGQILTVELPGGQQLRVRGTGAINSKVFVRDGVVESAAPNLPVDEITL